jgi:chemotaxis receptor (MCP) glutamine deamidase CheD
VPEILHPFVNRLIDHLHATGETPHSWAHRWLSKAQGKESQPRYKFLVQAIEEMMEKLYESGGDQS